VSSSGLLLGGEWTEEFILLGLGLVLTVTDLGRSINELEIDLVGMPRGRWLQERLSESDLSLSWAHNTTLDDDEVLVNDTVVRESTQWGNVLDIWVHLGLSVVINTSVSTSTNSVDLLVHLSSVVVTEVTSSGNSPLNGRWMPCTNTGDLSETSMSLSWKSVDIESLDNTTSSLTSGDRNGINHLILLEDRANSDILLEVVLSPLDLGGSVTTVELDFHEMGLLLSEVSHLINLGGSENSDNSAVLLDSFDISVDVFFVLCLKSPSLGVLGESLATVVLFSKMPVLVESSLHRVRQVLSPD
jgi:hypothetical protein